MKKFSALTLKGKAAVAGVSVLAVAGSGVAFALWTATATGPASSQAINAQVINLTAVAGVADLYPGASGAVAFTLTNPNPYPVTFTSLTPGTVTSSNPTACPASNVAGNALTGLTGLDVAANATSGTLSVPGAVSMVSAAPDGCQGVTFTVALTLNGSQQ